jgi:hypothetical protein
LKPSLLGSFLRCAVAAMRLVTSFDIKIRSNEIKAARLCEKCESYAVFGE